MKTTHGNPRELLREIAPAAVDERNVAHIMSNKRTPGQIPHFLRKRLGYSTRTKFTYGDTLRIGLNSRTFLLTAPEDIHHVLVGNAANFTKGKELSNADAQKRAGSGLLTSVGKDHKLKKRALQQPFLERSIGVFADAIHHCTIDRVSRWEAGQQLDMAAEMSELALDILLTILFGNGWNRERETFIAAIHDRRRYTEFLYHSKIPFRKLLPLPVNRRNERAMADIDRIIRSEIQIRRAHPQNDFVSSLMRTKRAGGDIDDSGLRDEILTLTTAGHETIADAMTWCWYFIATNPHVEERWIKEVHAEFDADNINVESIRRLRYTHAILDESIRLRPPTWLFARIPQDAETLPSGFSTQSGDTLLLCQYIMHRHPDYFPDPEKFDPDRFQNGVERNVLKSCFFPFGAGPHICIGEALARFESAVVLATIGSRFHAEIDPATKVVMEPAVTLTPKHGLKVTLKDRHSPSRNLSPVDLRELRT
jgi:cytochrome P450